MPKRARRSPAALLASLDEAERAAFFEGLSENALGALPWLWEVWAHPGHQLEPEGDWQTWVILGGRGAGKTRAGAEWVRAAVEGPTPDAPGRARRVALVGETIDQVRAVMVEGESGLSGALWTPAMIDAARVTETPDLDRVVVGVDPPVTAGPDADECGIVVAGLSKKGAEGDWKVFVLADESAAGLGPAAWARVSDASRRRSSRHGIQIVPQGRGAR